MKEILTAYIVDDEKIARYNLVKKLEGFKEIRIIGEADSVATAIIGINELKPDILFLDIQLTDGTGFDLLDKVRYYGKIIFITAFDEYAIRAFEINALDYLLKPISSKRLRTSLERINNPNPEIQYESLVKLNTEDRIMVTTKDSLHFIKINDIIAIKSSGDYTLVELQNNKEYLVSKTMNEWESRLPNQQFCRINRQLIINFSSIIKIDKLFTNSVFVHIKGYDEPFKISKTYYKKIKDRYK